MNTCRSSSRLAATIAALLTLGLFATACQDSPTAVDPLADGPPDARAAKGGKGGGNGGGGGSDSDPTVTGTSPTGATRDTTLDVRVFGSAFVAGSQATFELNGVPTPKVATNSTSFISQSELVANVTIAADAVTDFYDVAVRTPGGRRGVGIELFEVRLEPVALEGLSRRYSPEATGINGAGVIVGSSRDGSGTFRPVRWRPSGSGWDAPEVLSNAGSTGGVASAINEAGYIVGRLTVGGSARPVVWRPDGTRVDLPRHPDGGHHQPEDINARNTVVGLAAGHKVAWRHNPSTDAWTLEIIAPKHVAAHVNAVSDQDVAFGLVPNGSDELAVSWTYQGGAWAGPTVLSHAGLTGATARAVTGAGVAGTGGVGTPPDCSGGRGHHFVAVYWPSATAAPVLVPGLEGAPSWAYDITGSGVVVGTRNTTCAGGSRGFLWSPGRPLVLLAPLRGKGTSAGTSHAVAANDQGQVIGRSSSGAAVAWRAVP